MDCDHARLLLEVAHPIATELDARDTEQLAAHLASCPDCGARAESDRLADEQLGRVMSDVPVPDGLKFRLLNRLNRERDAWYRGWALRAAGLAAMLLLTASLTYGLWWNKKPTPDLHQLLDDVNAIVDSADRVEDAFKAKGITMTAPRVFEYRYLHSFDMADFQGKKVPYLLFRPDRRVGNTGPPMAKVFVLSNRQFNLDGMRNPTPLAGSQQNIQVLQDPSNAHVIYVVVYTTGHKIQEFLRETKPDN
jgi:hypothetical protein